jgi:hypothetical protein
VKFANAGVVPLRLDATWFNEELYNFIDTFARLESTAVTFTMMYVLFVYDPADSVGDTYVVTGAPESTLNVLLALFTLPEAPPKSYAVMFNVCAPFVRLADVNMQ